MSLSHRFFLFVSLPVLACLFALSAALYLFSRQELEKEYEKRLLTHAARVRTLLADTLELTRNDLAILMTSTLLERYFMYGDNGDLDYQEDARATLEESFLAASKARPHYASLRLFTMEGEGIVNVSNRQLMYKYSDPRGTEWFSTAAWLKDNEIHVSAVSPCPEHQAPSLFLCQLFYYEGTPRAIASIHLHVRDYFAAILREAGRPQGGEIFLTGAGGEIIAHPDPEKLGRRGEEAAVIQGLLARGGQPFIRNDFRGAVPMKRVSFPLGIGGAVGVILQPYTEIEASTRKLEQRLAGVGAFTAAALLLLVYCAIKKITRPLSDLEKATRIIAGGNLGVRVGLAGNDEIGRLSASFDEMADSLERSQLELRQALAEVKKLSGFLPICASCKKIRDDQGYWSQIESYISQHSEAVFSHGICPDCLKKLYPDM